MPSHMPSFAGCPPLWRIREYAANEGKSVASDPFVLTRRRLAYPWTVRTGRSDTGLDPRIAGRLPGSTHRGMHHGHKHQQGASGPERREQIMRWFLQRN